MLCCGVLQVACIVGVNEGYIGQRCRGGGAQSDASTKHARFAAACALNALLCEQSAWTVEQTWGLPSSLTQQGQPLLKHELTCAKIINITLFPRLSLPALILRPTALLAVLWRPCYVSYVSKERLWACCPPGLDKVQYCQRSPSMLSSYQTGDPERMWNICAISERDLTEPMQDNNHQWVDST